MLLQTFPDLLFEFVISPPSMACPSLCFLPINPIHWEKLFHYCNHPHCTHPARGNKRSHFFVGRIVKENLLLSSTPEALRGLSEEALGLPVKICSRTSSFHGLHAGLDWRKLPRRGQPVTPKHPRNPNFKFPALKQGGRRNLFRRCHEKANTSFPVTCHRVAGSRNGGTGFPPQRTTGFQFACGYPSTGARAARAAA